jgi:hypothetical protein
MPRRSEPIFDIVNKTGAVAMAQATPPRLRACGASAGGDAPPRCSREGSHPSRPLDMG